MHHTPYKGGGPAVVDLLGGHVDGRIDQIPSSLAHIQAKRIRAIAVTTARRAELLPGVPTLIESGVPGFDASTVIGIFAPAGTPATVVNRLHGEISKIVQLPDIKERWAALGAEPLHNAPEQFAAFLKSDLGKWAKVVRDSGAKID